MSLGKQVDLSELHLLGLELLRKRWGWYLGLGILLVVLGALALSVPMFATITTMVFIGWLLFIGGVVEIAHAFSCRAWGGFFLDLLTGVLYAFAGLMTIRNPAAGGVALTFMIAMLLLFGGILRIAVAVAMRFQHGVWLLINGAVNILLAVLILAGWPSDSLVVIGAFVGIDMLLNGWSLIMLALAAKRLPAAG